MAARPFWDIETRLIIAVAVDSSFVILNKYTSHFHWISAQHQQQCTEATGSDFQNGVWELLKRWSWVQNCLYNMDIEHSLEVPSSVTALHLILSKLNCTGLWNLMCSSPSQGHHCQTSTPSPNKKGATHFLTVTFTNAHQSSWFLVCSFASEY